MSREFAWVDGGGYLAWIFQSVATAIRGDDPSYKPTRVFAEFLEKLNAVAYDIGTAEGGDGYWTADDLKYVDDAIAALQEYRTSLETELKRTAK